MTNAEKLTLAKHACHIRMGVIEGTHSAKCGHPGGSLDIAEVLSYLYFVDMNIDPKEPKKPDRDRFVLSKGHAAPALYATLAERGFFPVEDLKTLRKIGTFTNLWGWGTHYNLEWRTAHGLCWIRQKRNDLPVERLWAPVGDWYAADWAAMPELVPGTTILRAPEPLCELLLERLPGRVAIEETPGQWEYLYTQEALSTLAGNKLHKKKNHVNGYMKAYGEDYRALNGEIMPQVLALQDDWCKWRECEKSASLLAESDDELILDFVETGIVVLNSKGAVYQKNKKATQLLGMDVFTHTKQLSRISDELKNVMEEALPGDKSQVQVSTERGTINLALRVSGINIKEEELRIIALSDINRELDEREIDSWIRLTRVLTHEIMNSLTPVTSLSETLLQLPGAENEEMRQGLETIHTTGKGLINFVMSYRKLTRLPSPEPSLFYVRPFLERMIKLACHQHPCPHISISLHEAKDDLIVFADENLIAQVVTNLLKNAIQAIGDTPDGLITLRAANRKYR